MGDVLLKSGIKTQRFTNDLGKAIILKINIGDPEVYVSWIKKAKEYDDMPKNLSDIETIQMLRPIISGLLKSLFGEKCYKNINRFCNNNLLAEIKIVETFVGIIESGMKEYSIKENASK